MTNNGISINKLSLTNGYCFFIIRPIIERCKAIMLRAIGDAELKPADIDKIILTGGPARMPIVRKFITSLMGKEPERGIDPMEAVAMGAAIQGALIAGNETTDRAKIIGIDLGTTNSAASIMIGGKPTMIPAAEETLVGRNAFPSYVGFTKRGPMLVGEPARKQKNITLKAR